MPTRNEIGAALHGISDAIQDSGHEVLFVENECPFVERDVQLPEDVLHTLRSAHPSSTQVAKHP